MFAITQRVTAPNDTSGNPRRGWIIYAIGTNGAQSRYFVTEGYSGELSLSDALDKIGAADIRNFADALNIPGATYSALCRNLPTI